MRGGKANRREKSVGFIFFSHFCSSQCQKQSRPDPDMPYSSMRPSPLHDRGDSDCSTCNRGSMTKQTNQRKQTLFRKHATPTQAQLCLSPESGLAGPCQVWVRVAMVAQTGPQEAPRPSLKPLSQLGEGDCGKARALCPPPLGPPHSLEPGLRAQLGLHQQVPALG